MSDELQLVRKEKSRTEEKARMIEIEYSRLKKEVEKNETVSSYIKNQFSIEPMEFIEETRSLKERNSLLNEENKRLRESLVEIEKKNNLMKNCKSMTSLTMLPLTLDKPISSGLQKIIYEKQEKEGFSSVPNSQRGGLDYTFKKK